MTEFADKECEQKIIGIAIRYPAAISGLDAVKPEHFSVDVCRDLFMEITRQIAENGKVAIESLRQFPPRVIADCISAADTVGDMGFMAARLVEMANRRSIDDTCNRVRLMLREGNTTGDVMPILQTVYTSTSFGVDSRFHDARAVTRKLVQEKQKPYASYPSSLSRLDHALGGGFFENKLYCFSARKKVGKTILASTLSHNLNKNGIRHLFICGEMGESEVHQRCLARELYCYPDELRNPTPAMVEKLNIIAERGEDNAIYYDAPGITFEELKQAVGMAKARYDIKGYIMDYWQLVGGKPRNMNTAEHLGEVAQWMAEICRRLKLFGIVMAQMNQDGNTRGSEAIRLSADQVFQIHREDITGPDAWLEMLETRHTAWVSVGSKNKPGLYMNERGPFFEEPDDGPLFSHA